MPPTRPPTSSSMPAATRATAADVPCRAEVERAHRARVAWARPACRAAKTARTAKPAATVRAPGAAAVASHAAPTTLARRADVAAPTTNVSEPTPDAAT